ncbi:hypothetical protein BJ546DRAFT_696292 [Cryomyces antarcticus]
MQELDLLILGAGWTSTFLIPLLKSRHQAYAATTTTGRDGTIKFQFDPSASDSSYFSILPTARNVLITFPLVGTGQSKLIISSYLSTRPHTSSATTRFMQLGSTGIFQIPTQPLWVSRHSQYDTENKRAVAEDELIALGGCVLNLAGLWGGPRDPRHWVDRVAQTKEQVKNKTSLHMVHGVDVARAILAVFERWDSAKAPGRWMLTDGFVYDWWALFAGWADVEEDPKIVSDIERDCDEPKPRQQSSWVYELMQEEGVRALPRSMEMLGRCYDSREFWTTFGITPLRARI